jgi:hypothetical protein
LRYIEDPHIQMIPNPIPYEENSDGPPREIILSRCLVSLGPYEFVSK